MESALNKYSIEEIKKIIEKNKKIELNDENIKKGLTGICPLCGEPWDMKKHWGTVMGEYDNEEYLLIENNEFGIVHDLCNSMLEEGEFKDLLKALRESEKPKEPQKASAEIKPDEQDEEALPIHESLEIVKYHTFRKSNKWWTAIVATRSTLAKNPRTTLSFYRWRKDKEGKWKRIKKWTINSKKDWEKIKKIVNEEFSDVLWK